MANIFKKVIDRMEWVQTPAAPNAHAAGGALCSDLRSDISRNPFAYQLVSATVLNRFNFVTKAWNFVQSPALAGTFGAGAAMAFVPSFGAVGTIASATTTSVTLSTALGTAPGLNMLANRGGSGDYGFNLRIIDYVAGKTVERWIVANTASTTPTITVNESFGFTPSAGARYEILAGRLMMLCAGTQASGSFKSIEIATNTLASLGYTNLPASVSTDTAMLVLDEQYTPYDMVPGEGMIKGSYLYDSSVVSRYALTATASAAGTLTGQASGGDAVVLANEYRNFQIRIVVDTTTPAAVGQRRLIASHTAGASPVYTLGAAWTKTPSATAKYVIELPNQIILRSTAATTVYVYNYTDASYTNGTTTIAAGAWSTAYYTAAGAANASGGMWCPSWGFQPDAARNARHSYNYFFRGGGVSTLDVLDIAGGTTGAWTSAITYGGAVTMAGGSSAAYSPFGNDGRMTYIDSYVASATNQIFRFDAKHRVLSPYTPTDFIQSSTAAVGGRMTAYAAIDGDDLYDVVLLLSHLSTITQELIPLV